MQIAGWGGVIVASTGFFLQNRLIENIRNTEHYKDALKTLRLNVGAVHYLGEPIKDKRIKLTDSENNNADETSARFCVPVTGPKDKGCYYFWAEKKNDKWSVVKAELELKSKPDQRLIIVKEK